MSNIAEKVLFNHLKSPEKYFLHEKMRLHNAIIVFLTEARHLLNKEKKRNIFGNSGSSTHPVYVSTLVIKR